MLYVMINLVHYHHSYYSNDEYDPELDVERSTVDSYKSVETKILKEDIENQIYELACRLGKCRVKQKKAILFLLDSMYRNKSKDYDENECKQLSVRTLIYKYGLSDGVCNLVRMDYAKKHGIYHDERLVQGSEGVEFSLRAFYYAHKALYINRCFYHYRYVPNSISKKVDENNTKFLADCYRVIREDIEGFVMKDKFIKAFLSFNT